MVFGGGVFRKTVVSFRYKVSMSKALERKNFNRVVWHSGFILSADITELTLRMLGLMIKPMMILQKLTRLACLVRVEIFNNLL
jgi:hypothetical protein